MTPTELTAALAAPFPGTAVSWRVGSTTKDKSKGMALAYIDARDVMTRLDDVCGPAGWQCRYPHTGKHVVCEIGIKIGDEWIWKANGAGDTDVEAVKGGMSDALKRAAVMWGIGRYLYDMKAPWVALEQKGRSYIIKPSENAKLARLANLDGGSQAPAQQSPATTTAPQPRAKSRDLYTRLSAKVDGFTTPHELELWTDDKHVKAARASLPADWARDLSGEINAKLHSLTDAMAAA